MSVNKVSAVRLREAKGRLSYKRGGEELKGKNKSENRRERGKIPHSTSRFIFIITYLKLFLLV
jgi:hypothetical protein